LVVAVPTESDSDKSVQCTERRNTRTRAHSSARESEEITDFTILFSIKLYLCTPTAALQQIEQFGNGRHELDCN